MRGVARRATWVMVLATSVTSAVSLFRIPAVAGDRPAAAQLEQWCSHIRSALFISDPLPPLDAKTHSRFEQEPGVVAERFTYATQFGLRVPAIL
jgi:hypothetical protein